MSNDFDLHIVELPPPKPGLWFKFEVYTNDLVIAQFETEIDKGYDLDGDRETVYTLYKIRVEPDYRRLGIGSLVIQHCASLAHSLGINKLVCLVKPYDRSLSEEDLKLFYLQNGFRFISAQGNLYAVKDL